MTEYVSKGSRVGPREPRAYILNWRRLFPELSAILCRHDPIHICVEEVNPDEYDPEASTILPRLAAVGSQREVHRIVYEEFARWFDSSAGPEERYATLSNEIWATVLRSRGPVPAWVGRLSLDPEERLLGVYENGQELRFRDIAITSKELYLRDVDRFEYLLYSEITKLDFPPFTEDRGVDQLVVHLRGGKAVELPVTGGRDRHRHGYLFFTYLRNAIRISRPRTY